MEQGIVITPTLRQKFQWAWEQRQVIFFSAPCGFGKTAAASVLLEPYAVCRWDAMDTGPPEPVPDCEAALVDNLQELKNPNAQKALLAAIRENPEIHFILLGRNRTPGWLMPFQYEPRMYVFEAQDLMLDQETAEKLLAWHGVRTTASELSTVMQASKGYPLALRILCRQMQRGRHYGESVDGEVRRELFYHFQTAVYQRFRPAVRRLLLDLAPFEPFDVEFARMLSGNSRAGELLGEVQPVLAVIPTVSALAAGQGVQHGGTEESLCPRGSLLRAARPVQARSGLLYEVRGVPQDFRAAD